MVEKTPKKVPLTQQLRADLARKKATYQTQLSRQETALRISTDTKQSPERRAEAKADYKRLVKEIEALKDSISETEQELNKEKASKNLENYDEKKGKEQAKALEEKYQLLSEAYDVSKDEAIKKQLDKVASDYKAVYDSVIGKPISKAVAYSRLNKTTTTFGDGSSNEVAPEVKPSPQKKPSDTKSSAPTKQVEAAQLPNEPAYTVNPVTGQRIKVSDIKPAGAGTEVTKPNIGPGINDVADERTAEALGAADALALTGTLFKHVDSLKNLLDQYVKKGWTNARFLQELRNDPWYKQNSAEIKARYTQLYNYQDLVATGQATGNTDYEKQIADLERQLADKARTIGSNAASDPTALRKAAENMYITNVKIDDAIVTDFLASSIKSIGSMIGGKPTTGYSGEALTNYQDLVTTARNNGFEVSDIVPGATSVEQVLAGIATGRIDINRVKQDARKLAAQGQPQYVRDLLSQGYDLKDVFAPYRKVMGTVLEVNPDEIDLNDPTLRTAITDKGDMNLYDFKKALRQDNRWQYTEQAKSDVSTAALTVLKDFGFQG